MNICLTTRYFDFRGTGVTRVATEITKGLVRRGHSVQMVSTKGTSLYSYFFYTLLGVPLQLPRRGIDVYHSLTTPEGMWLPKDRSVVTFLDLMPILHADKFGSGMGYSSWKKVVGKKYAQISWKLASRKRFLACISDDVKKDMITHMGIPEERIKVIRLGIQENLNPRPKKDSTFRLGVLGQLDKRKRVDMVIEAFKRGSLDAELVIGGDGMDRPLLETLAGDDNRIKFLGLVPDSELADFYNSLDVLIFPSGAEGYGLPPVEAMACKKPVIVLGDAIIPWEVKSKCIIVKDLQASMANQSYLEGVCKGVDYEGNYEFAKKHSWDKTVDAYIKLYEEVLS